MSATTLASSSIEPIIKRGNIKNDLNEGGENKNQIKSFTLKLHRVTCIFVANRTRFNLAQYVTN